MKNKIFKKSFTLVELLVSMGVFSVLLVLFMQFFSGTQKIWSAGEKNNVLDARARAVLNTLGNLVQCIYYTPGNTEYDSSDHVLAAHKDSYFLRIDKGKTAGAAAADVQPDALYCAVKAKLDLPGISQIRFISVQLPNKLDSKYSGSGYAGLYGTLMVTVLGDDDKVDKADAPHYTRFFPDFRMAPSSYSSYPHGSSPYEKSFADLIGILDGKLTKNGAEDTRFVLAKSVADFRIEAYKYEASGSSEITAGLEQKTAIGNRYALDFEPGVQGRVKIALKITVDLLSDADYERWDALTGSAKTKFLAENKRTYSRLIYLGDRWSQQE